MAAVAAADIVAFMESAVIAGTPNIAERAATMVGKSRNTEVVGCWNGALMDCWVISKPFETCLTIRVTSCWG